MRAAFSLAKAGGRWQQWRPFLLALGVVIVVAGIASGFTALVVYRYGGNLFGPTFLMFGSGIVSAVSAFTAAVTMRWGLRRFNRVEIRRAMQTLGYDLCTQCGYWLKGLGEEVRKCPECGGRREV